MKNKVRATMHGAISIVNAIATGNGSAPGFIEHPCPFPEEIPYRLMKLYSYEGDTVLDPFNGSGQTTKVAFHFQRHYIGIDTIKEYIKLAKSRLADEPLHIRPEVLIANWKKIPSHYKF